MAEASEFALLGLQLFMYFFHNNFQNNIFIRRFVSYWNWSPLHSILLSENFMNSGEKKNPFLETVKYH